MQWPLRWFKRVELALNVYDTLTTVNDAVSRLEGKVLADWNSRNAKMVEAALNITAIRDELEADNG